MKELTLGQTKHITGGAGAWSLVLKIAFTTFVNIGNYIIHKKNHREKITVEGLVIAAGSGMIAGSAIHKNKFIENEQLTDNNTP